MTATTLVAPRAAGLAPAEATRLKELESVIAAGLGHFVAVGRALAEIVEKKLYRAEFANFAEYCVSRWGIQRTHARRVIEAASIASALDPKGAVQPRRESQMRALAEAPKEERQAIWDESVKDAGGKQPRAKNIEAHVKKTKEKAGPNARKRELDEHQKELKRRNAEQAKQAQPVTRADELRRVVEHLSPAMAALVRVGMTDAHDHLAAARKLVELEMERTKEEAAS